MAKVVRALRARVRLYLARGRLVSDLDGVSDLAALVAEMRALGVAEASFCDGKPTRIVLGRAPVEPEAHAVEDASEARARREATLYGASR